jgi:hypothetical protein
MKNERNQLHSLVGKKRKSTEVDIDCNIKDLTENKKKRSRKSSHDESDDESYHEEGFRTEHQFLCSPSTRRLAEQMGRQLSATLLETKFAGKKRIHNHTVKCVPNKNAHWLVKAIR